MELHFTIPPALTQSRLAELLEREMLKHDQQIGKRTLAGPPALAFAVCPVPSCRRAYNLFA